MKFIKNYYNVKESLDFYLNHYLSNTTKPQISNNGGWRNATKSEIIEAMDPGKIKNEIHYLQFMNLNFFEISISSLNKVLKGKGILEGCGSHFYNAGKIHNVNPIYLVAHSCLETGNGTSYLATKATYNHTNVYNVYGIGAIDSDPNGGGSKKAYEMGWFSIESAIKGGAKFIGEDYINGQDNQNTLYKMRFNLNGRLWKQYCTDCFWCQKQTNRINELVKDLDITIPLEIPKFKNMESGKMKIGLDFGHGVGQDRGAVNEEYLIGLIGPQIQGHLQNLGHQVVLCRPSSASSVSDSLNKRCNTANNQNCDIFVSLHCNAFNGSARGSEILTYDGKDKLGAAKTLQEYAQIGFTNRGVKSGSSLAVLRGTSMPSMLVEFCFGDNPQDKGLMEANIDKMARILVSNITGTDIRVNQPPQQITCDCSLDSVQLDTRPEELNGICLKGWFESGEFELIVNNESKGVRQCNVSRPDVAAHLGRTDTTMFGYDLGVIADALRPGLNELRLEYYQTILIYRADFLK